MKKQDLINPFSFYRLCELNIFWFVKSVQVEPFYEDGGKTPSFYILSVYFFMKDEPDNIEILRFRSGNLRSALEMGRTSLLVHLSNNPLHIEKIKRDVSEIYNIIMDIDKGRSDISHVSYYITG